MPHDRFYGMAAAEIAEQRPDRDLFARAYAMALGDSEKTKAIYIGIRAERLEEEAAQAARREAEAERARVQREAVARTRAFPQKVDVPSSREGVAPKEESTVFTDPHMGKAVQAMRDALAASKFQNG